MNVLARFVSSRFSSASASASASPASALVKRKRFYKEVGLVNEIVADKQIFKVTLDGRVLKTQGGKPLQIESEPLALAIAEEWASQDEHIAMGHMRLTGLAYTAQDNPLHTTKQSMADKILEYLEGDTVLYWNPDISNVHEAQQQYWKPVIDHCNSQLGTSIVHSENVLGASISDADRVRVEKWLLSHGHWALTGLQYAVESAKSLMLPFAVCSFHLTAPQAVHHAMLEQKVQSRTWGEVEWAHGIEEEELTARLSAASLFVYFNSNQYTSLPVQN